MVLAVFAVSRVCAEEPAGSVVLEAVSAKIIRAAGDTAKFETAGDRRCVGYWHSTNTVVRWTFELKERATFRVVLVYASQCPEPGPEVEVTAGAQKANGFVKPTGDWGKFTEQDLGPVLLRKPGTVEVAARVTRMCGERGVNLRAVKLVKEP